MTTGTEGPDVLSNDPNSGSDTILALGGDDTINVTNPNAPAGTIVVDGGAGVDTLRIGPTYMSSMEPGVASMNGGPLTPGHTVSYASVERLVVYAGAFAGPQTGGGQLQDVRWRTGDSSDEIHVILANSIPARVTVETGGGDDKIYFDSAWDGSTARGGPGNDLIDFRGFQRNNASAFGDEGNDTLIGSASDDWLDGGEGNDRILAMGGGSDVVLGQAGDDILYYGAAFNSHYRTEGGEGRDALVLQGNYNTSVGGTSLTGIETISLLTGANAEFGDVADNRYDYQLTFYESSGGNLLGAGQQLTIDGHSLQAGEDFAFDGTAETDGKFLVFGGHGIDTLKGGAGNDIFVFDGYRWGAGDRVDGGAGAGDVVVITGSTGLVRVEFGATSLVGVESLSVSNRYASDPSALPTYEFVLANGNVAPGATLIVNASSLVVGQLMKLDGRDVHDGKLILFGGAGHDTLTGGDGADVLIGGGRTDAVTGGPGADTFRYDSASDSTASTPDLIGDFQAGLDRIDLSRIDANSGVAGDQAFSWIGSSAFSGLAGELRAFADNGYQRIEGDTDGDGNADLVIVLQVGAAPLAPGDFLL